MSVPYTIISLNFPTRIFDPNIRLRVPYTSFVVEIYSQNIGQDRAGPEQQGRAVTFWDPVEWWGASRRARVTTPGPDRGLVTRAHIFIFKILLIRNINSSRRF